MQPEDKPDVSGIAKFDSSTLKHVETEEKDVKPTKDGMCQFACSFIKT